MTFCFAIFACLAAIVSASVPRYDDRAFDSLLMKRQIAINQTSSSLVVDLGYEQYLGVANLSTGLKTWKGQGTIRPVVDSSGAHKDFQDPLRSPAYRASTLATSPTTIRRPQPDTARRHSTPKLSTNSKSTHPKWFQLHRNRRLLVLERLCSAKRDESAGFGIHPWWWVRPGTGKHGYEPYHQR